jgi:succinate dehydrogenase assembly factor 2
LLLSTFADKYLPSMSSEELNEYDAVCKMSIPRLMRQQLLDEPDWEIYYWATGKKPTPPEWIDSEILASLKQHVKNEGKVILRMPDLQAKSK